MRRKRPWRDSYVLGSTFSQVASLRDWKHAKFVKVRLKERTPDQAHPARLELDVDALDQIEFEYLVIFRVLLPVYKSLYLTCDLSRAPCGLYPFFKMFLIAPLAINRNRVLDGECKAHVWTHYRPPDAG